MHEADKYPQPTVIGHRARGPRDIEWVLTVGVAPLLVLVLTMPIMALIDHQDLLPGALGDWNLYAVFGLTVFAPIMIVACVAALVMIADFRAGRAVSTFGNVLAILCMTVLATAEITDLFRPVVDGDPAGWVSALTPSGTPLFVAPYIAVLVANAFVALRLWRQRQ